MRAIHHIALLALASSFAGSANAQTAEETVAFILSGVEDGSKIVSRGADVSVIATVKQANASPATFVVTPPGKTNLRSITVSQIDSCRFRVEREDAKQGKWSPAVYDFSKVTDVTYTLGFGLLNFAGPCAIKGEDGSCNKTSLIDAEMGTPPPRVRKALAYLKEKYCAGAAF